MQGMMWQQHPLSFGLAITAQLLIGFLWDGWIAATPLMYYSAADKGVRRFEYIKQRYSSLWVLIAALCGSAARVALLGLCIDTAHSLSSSRLQEAVLMVATFFFLLGVERDCRAQRPWQLVLLMAIREIVVTFMAAVGILVGKN